MVGSSAHFLRYGDAGQVGTVEDALRYAVDSEYCLPVHLHHGSGSDKRTRIRSNSGGGTESDREAGTNLVAGAGPAPLSTLSANSGGKFKPPQSHDDDDSGGDDDGGVGDDGGGDDGGNGVDDGNGRK